MTNKKAQFVNTLTIILAVAIMLVGVISIANDPSITGFAGKNKLTKVDKAVSDAFDSNEDVDVIVILKEDKIVEEPQIGTLSVKEKKLKSESKLNKIKDNVKKKQDSVLANLDYENNTKNVSSKKELKLKYKYTTIPGFSGKVTKEGLAKLQNDPNVEAVYPVRNISATLVNSVPLIRADQVWNVSMNGRNITGQGQVVCVIDSGVDYGHESLGGCTNTSFLAGNCSKVITGYDFVNSDSDPMDDYGHGTHVAGIVAANGSVVGVAPGAKIVALKVLNNNGGGSDANVIAAIDWCRNNASLFNISIISMSLGDGGIYNDVNICPTSMDTALGNAFNSGIDIFVASGNNGTTNGIAYPACSPYSFSVGASDDSDNMASFTNRYSSLNIVAPGVSIYSASRGGGISNKQGTSMATPHVSGVAALIRQYEAELGNVQPTPKKVQGLLLKSPYSVVSEGNSYVRVDALTSVISILKLNVSDNSAYGVNGGVKFASSTDLENTSKAFDISKNFISLNSSKYPYYNKSANITFYGVSYTANPLVYGDGVLCTDCNVYSHTGNTTFDVTHFSNYTTGVNARLDIFDQADAEGGSKFTNTGSQVYFYGNYTNISSNASISTGSCSINVSD
jgi:subtilisin family serine protease